MSINERNTISSKKRVTSIDSQHKISENNKIVAGPVIVTNTNKRRRCASCCEKGHHQYLCRRIKTDFGKFLLPKNDDAARNSLAKLLVLVDPTCGSPLLIRQFNDKN